MRKKIRSSILFTVHCYETRRAQSVEEFDDFSGTTSTGPFSALTTNKSGKHFDMSMSTPNSCLSQSQLRLRKHDIQHCASHTGITHLKSPIQNSWKRLNDQKCKTYFVQLRPHKRAIREPCCVRLRKEEMAKHQEPSGS